MAPPLLMIIQDFETGESITTPSWSQPQFSRDPSYDDVPIRGRSEPHQFYAYTGTAIWNISLVLIASIDADDEGKVKTVKKQLNFLESLTMPDYGPTPLETAGVVKPPHLTRVNIRRMFNVIGTLRNLSYTLEGPYDELGMSHRASVTFTLHALRQVRPLGFAAIRELSLADRGE